MPFKGTLVVDGLVKNDRFMSGLSPLDVVEATGQIYCPTAVGSAAVAEYAAAPGSYAKPFSHLFVHQMPIGSIIALAILDAEPTGGYASDDTDAEFEYSLNQALLVRITSDVKAGAMKGRALIRNATYCSHHEQLEPSCWMCRSSIKQLLLNETVIAAAAAAADLQKRLPLIPGIAPPRCIVDDFVALHRDVEVLGRVTSAGCEDPHYFEWNHGGVIKCTQTRVYIADIQK